MSEKIPFVQQGESIFGEEKPIRQQMEESSFEKDRASFEQTLHGLKEYAKSFVEDSSVIYGPLGDFLERYLEKENHIPPVIISEDASGRFAAQIMKRLYGKINERMFRSRTNVPVLSYGVGRSTTPEQAQIQAEKLVHTLKSKYPHHYALFITDTLMSGGSIKPLLEIIKKEEEKGESVGYFKLMTGYKGTDEEMHKLDPELKQYLYLTLPNPIKEWDAHNTIFRPVRRDDSRVIPSWTSIAAHPYRVRAVDEISDVMYEALLERPRVKAMRDQKG